MIPALPATAWQLPRVAWTGVACASRQPCGSPMTAWPADHQPEDASPIIMHTTLRESELQIWIKKGSPELSARFSRDASPSPDRVRIKKLRNLPLSPRKTCGGGCRGPRGNIFILRAQWLSRAAAPGAGLTNHLTRAPAPGAEERSSPAASATSCAAARRALALRLDIGAATAYCEDIAPDLGSSTPEYEGQQRTGVFLLRPAPLRRSGPVKGKSPRELIPPTANYRAGLATSYVKFLTD